MSTDKIIAFDSLRVFAIFSVIILHASASLFSELYPSNEWLAANFYESISRWNVSVFFMISGALFLRKSKKLNLKRLYSKNIFHIVIVFFFWSILYAIYEFWGKCNFSAILNNILIGPHHFWFLKALLGLYIAIPIFRHIVSSKKTEIFFLLTTFILGIVIPSLIVTVGVFDRPFEQLLTGIYDKFNVQLISTYSFYFVIGHYFIEYPLNYTGRHILYFLGAISPFAVMLSSYYVSELNGAPFMPFLENYFICTALEASAIYILFTSCYKSGKYDVIFAQMSKRVMGIYIVHVFIMDWFTDIGINPTSCNLIFFIPIYSLLVFVVSYCFVVVLQKIPLVNKLI
ncbi:MAG: hypothetical protein E7081_10130 [Bacteroidales bacterium]|nr:hypothetical protein [Bacteroidales bacterium]